jgi:hypothetical protein
LIGVGYAAAKKLRDSGLYSAVVNQTGPDNRREMLCKSSCGLSRSGCLVTVLSVSPISSGYALQTVLRCPEIYSI